MSEINNTSIGKIVSIQTSNNVSFGKKQNAKNNNEKQTEVVYEEIPANALSYRAGIKDNFEKDMMSFKGCQKAASMAENVYQQAISNGVSQERALNIHRAAFKEFSR